MEYNKLGKAGIRVSELGYGSWVTFAKQLGRSDIRALMHKAFDMGVNFFDTAEAYANGAAESCMGEVLKDFRREDLVISTKLFWGGEGVNDTGLSRKHLVEGTKASLKRLQLDYVDLLFCHRPDPKTPIEETVITMDMLIRQGFALYWGTSEWSSDEIETAYRVCEQQHCIAPSMEQPEYNLFNQVKVEKEYSRLYKKYQIGLTTWSPLAYGVLTGKYKHGIPDNSRLAKENWLLPDDFEHQVKVTNKLCELANKVGCSMPQLAIAWCLKNPNVSSVITGASSLPQLVDNLQAANIKEKLTDSVLDEIEKLVA